MTKLLQQLHDELVRRHYAASTVQSCLTIVEAFRRHVGKRLDRLGPDDLRRYHVFLLEDWQLDVGTVVTHITALRFLFRRVRKRYRFPVSTMSPRSPPPSSSRIASATALGLRCLYSASSSNRDARATKR